MNTAGPCCTTGLLGNFIWLHSDVTHWCQTAEQLRSKKHKCWRCDTYVPCKAGFYLLQPHHGAYMQIYLYFSYFLIHDFNLCPLLCVHLGDSIRAVLTFSVFITTVSSITRASNVPTVSRSQYLNALRPDVTSTEPVQLELLRLIHDLFSSLIKHNGCC